MLRKERLFQKDGFFVKFFLFLSIDFKEEFYYKMHCAVKVL